jgi:homopolymeric O-antigen transport system permease protein
MSVVHDRAVATRPAAEPTVTAAVSLDRLPVTVIGPWKQGVLARFKELWRNKRVLPYLMKEFIAKRYRRTYLGLLWIPLRPGLDIASRSLLFGGFLQVGSGDRPYFIFIAFASAGWQVFDSSLKWSSRALQRGKSIVSGLHFPRLVLMSGAVGPVALDFLTYAAVAIIGTAYYLFFQGTNYLAAPQQWILGIVGLAMLLLFGVGLGLIIGPVSMHTREIRYMLSYFTQFLYFVTPVVYDLNHIPPQYRKIAEVNPLTAPMELVKYGFLDTSLPSATSMTISFVGLGLLTFFGLNFFSRLERAAVERL